MRPHSSSRRSISHHDGRSD